MAFNQFSKLRIIGGRWRSRKIIFPSLPGLRPTPDRIRETLFNWLAPVIQDAHFLDAFAGSGALGFEALSRGAASGVMIEQSLQVVKMLRENAQRLAANNLEIIQGNFPYILAAQKQKFNIVFLDPPFHQNIINPSLDWLAASHLLANHAVIYIEAEKNLNGLSLPKHWEIIRNKTAGNVNYYLVQLQLSDGI